jgi:regulator of replication initiation timing
MREDIQLSLTEVQMPRTRYQLEHFVIGAHDTLEMQFVQVCRELEALHYTIKEVAMQVRKTEYEIEDLRDKGDRISQVEADIKELGLERTRLVAIGAVREYDTLIEIYDQIPHFTREQIDASQPDYWQARLGRQTNLQIMSGGANWAHLEALDQVGVLSKLIQQQPTKELQQ